VFALAPALADAAPTCAGPQRTLDLGRWKAALKAAGTGPAVLAALEEAGLLRQPGEQATDGEKVEMLRQREAVSVHVDDFPAQLSPGGASDRVIQVIVTANVSGEGYGEGGTYRLRVAGALRPAAQGWCDLGVFLSEEDVILSGCEDYPGTTFAFERLLAQESQVIRATRHLILCNPGGRDQVDERSVAYWAVVQGRLALVFAHGVRANGYNVMAGQRSAEARITFTGGFPRGIRVEETVTCIPGMAVGNFCVPEGARGPNGDGYVDRSTVTFGFDGTRYVEKARTTRREKTGGEHGEQE
jgi:hypothetical protein